MTIMHNIVSSAIMLGVIAMSAIELSVIVLSVIELNVTFHNCCCECHYAEPSKEHFFNKNLCNDIIYVK